MIGGMSRPDRKSLGGGERWRGTRGSGRPGSATSILVVGTAIVEVGVVILLLVRSRHTFQKTVRSDTKLTKRVVAVTKDRSCHGCGGDGRRDARADAITACAAARADAYWWDKQIVEPSRGSESWRT